MKYQCYIQIAFLITFSFNLIGADFISGINGKLIINNESEYFSDIENAVKLIRHRLSIDENQPALISGTNDQYKKVKSNILINDGWIIVNDNICIHYFDGTSIDIKLGSKIRWIENIYLTHGTDSEMTPFFELVGQITVSKKP
jgi:hypothetical protein